MSNFGLGKGLGALIPDGPPPENIDEPEQNINSSESTPNQPDVKPEDDQVKVNVQMEQDQQIEVDNQNQQFSSNGISQNLEPAKTEATDNVEASNIPVNEPAIGQVGNIPTHNISPNPYQPRKDFDPIRLQELADSIRVHGIIQPLVVSKTPNGKGYELLAGERRLQAAKLLGLPTVPALVQVKELTNENKLELAIIENVQRDDLNVIEQARAYKQLNEEFGMTYEVISNNIGRSRPSISNTVRLLKLPVEMQRALIEKKIGEGHGRALLQIQDREKQFALFELIKNKKLTTDQALSMAREWSTMPHAIRQRSEKDEQTKVMEQQLRGKLGVKRVNITKYENGGASLEVVALSEDEFNNLIEKINSL